MAKESRAVMSSLSQVPSMADSTAGPKKAIVKGGSAAHDDELQECYEALLRRQPEIQEGTVEVHWMLDPRGKISSMQMVRSDWEDTTFTGCVMEQIKRMTFHSPSKSRPTLVAHKFNFHKRSPAAIDYREEL